jgi:hypothetical protein
MLRQRLRKLVAVLLVTVCPSTLLMAERPSAMLYATGAVTLNGMPAAKSMSVFVGDRIDTADASVVSVNRSGFSLVIDPNSSVQYQSNGFAILKGKASARTAAGMSAHAGALSVIAKGTSALFDISRDGKNIIVASREGALTLTDGVETATLEPGFTAKVSLDPQDPRPAASANGQATGQNGSPNQEFADNGQDQGPKPAATTSGDEDHRKRGMIILILASAAAGAAIIYCVLECGSGGGVPISPVTP